MIRHGAWGVVAIRLLAALIVGAGVAVTLSLIYRGPDHDIETGPDRHARLDVSPSTRATKLDVPGTPDSPAHVLAAHAELRDASESYRNSTLLTAIRDNGHDCVELTSVEPSEVALSDRTPPDPLGGWRVACRGALAYFVAVGRGGQLVVEPLPVGDYPVGPLQQVPQFQLPNPLPPPNTPR
jgi:hypothetical protein